MVLIGINDRKYGLILVTVHVRFQKIEVAFAFSRYICHDIYSAHIYNPTNRGTMKNCKPNGNRKTFQIHTKYNLQTFNLQVLSLLISFHDAKNNCH